MAKQAGPLRFTGRIGDFSFYYDRVHGHLVRRTGGVSSKKYFKDDRFAASRAASSEFSIVSATGKLIRQALAPFLAPVKDGTMVNRLNRVLVKLKQADNLNARGERRPDVLMTDPVAGMELAHFQFNSGAALPALPDHPLQLARHGSTLVVDGVLFPDATYPTGASHAGVTAVYTVIDFEAGCFSTASSRMALLSPATTAAQSLSIPELPVGAGVAFVCLQVLFFREQYGDLLLVPGRVHAMGIVQCIRTADAATDHLPKR